MQEIKKAYNKPIIFSKWSGKKYAIFASLHRVVNIARISIDICKASLLKSNTLNSLINLFEKDNLEEEDTDWEELQDSLLLKQLIPSITLDSYISYLKKIFRFNIRRPIFCFMQSMGLLFLIK